MTETIHTPRPSELVEHFLAEAISNSPQPLKDLAEFLSNALGEDDWKIADRLLLALSLRNRTSEPEAGAVAWRARMRPDGEWMVLDAEYVPGRSADDAVEVQPLYTHPAPETADKLKVAVEALEPFDAVMIDVGQGEDDDDLFRNSDRTYARGPAITVGHIRRAAAALAALNEQPQ